MQENLNKTCLREENCNDCPFRGYSCLCELSVEVRSIRTHQEIIDLVQKEINEVKEKNNDTK